MSRLQPQPPTFNVLLVCTANRCRSPMAEYMMRDAFARRWPSGAASWTFESAALRGQDGKAMDPTALALLASRGIDGSAFRTRTLTAEMVTRADVVLTATRAQRGRLVVFQPAALSRTFTLSQFGYLLSGAVRGIADNPVEVGIEAVQRAAQARTMMLGRTDDDDIADPVGKPMSVFRKCASRIETAVAQIVSALPAS